MDDKVAKRIHDIQESSTLQMARLSRELISQGLDIINLTLGEPDFDTPKHIREAAKKAIDDGFTHYTPVVGFPELRDAIVGKFKKENGLDYTPSQIIVSTGAKQSLINIVLSIIDEGDEVIIPAPYWVSYPEMVKLAEGKVVSVFAGVDQDYKITAAQLEAAITSKTRAFMYSSPSNPTGSFYSKEELSKLAEVFARHPHVIIISDEIYEHINFTKEGHASLAQFPSIKDRVVVVNGMSKAFAMTGWRIGYAAGPEWIIRACEKLQGQFTSGTSSISQKAAICALTSDMKPTDDMCEAFHKRRELLVAKLRAAKGLKYGVPDGAFYLFPDVSSYFGKSFNDIKINNADDLSMYLLKIARVSTVSGSGFGAPDCIRLSFATSEENITKACDRIIEALGNLN